MFPGDLISWSGDKDLLSVESLKCNAVTVLTAYQFKWTDNGWLAVVTSSHI